MEKQQRKKKVTVWWADKFVKRIKITSECEVLFHCHAVHSAPVTTVEPPLQKTNSKDQHSAHQNMLVLLCYSLGRAGGVFCMIGPRRSNLSFSVFDSG